MTSVIASLMCRSIDISGNAARNSGRRGATCCAPNETGAASRTMPRGACDRSRVASSAASPSARMLVARARSCRPSSVSSNLRAVRVISRAPSFASTRLIAFDTVAFDRRSSSAAPLKERHSATFAKIARPSRSGSLAMSADFENLGFPSFYFQADALSIRSSPKEITPGASADLFVCCRPWVVWRSPWNVRRMMR